MPDNAAQEALAEKLRAQRVAAEKLAEQRVQAARERAEGRTPPAELAAPRPSAPQRRHARRRLHPPKAQGRRSPAAARLPPQVQLRGRTPARHARRKRCASAACRGSAQPAAACAWRPAALLAPVSTRCRHAPAAALQARGSVRELWSTAPASAASGPCRLRHGSGIARLSRGPRGPQRRPPALESYPRQTEQRDFPEGEYDDGPPGAAPRASGAGRSADDFDEVFEDDGASRQRASARDYQSAYGEGEDAFAEDQRRSSGPWLLLLSLLATALVAGGVVLVLQLHHEGCGRERHDHGRRARGQRPGRSREGRPRSARRGHGGARPGEKQIYDRIVGDQEVLGGQIESTEEIPVPPVSACNPRAKCPLPALTRSRCLTPA
jgi:hypothetical protein